MQITWMIKNLNDKSHEKQIMPIMISHVNNKPRE